MNERETVRKLLAHHEGKPVPRGQKLAQYVASDEDILAVAFVRMGGESRPWGLAYGKPGEKPTVLAVAEARNRDEVTAMLLEFAPVLLRHLRVPGFGEEAANKGDLEPLRQVWLPNPTHLDMLQQLAYTYAFTKYAEPNTELANKFGRACNWLFRESLRPGQQAAVVATDALRSAYTFPAENTRLGHLGFLLAWLDAKGNRTSRLAAAATAERLTVATSLDPDFERSKMEKVVERWGEARRAEDDRGMSAQVRAASKLLAPELERRWALTVQAVAHLRNDPRGTNSGVAVLVSDTADDQWEEFNKAEAQAAAGEKAFFASVDTDRLALTAASRFMKHELAAETVERVLVHDDTELLAEAVAAGDALFGEIVEVRDDAPLPTGRGRGATRPVWVVRDTAIRQLRLRAGAKLCVATLPNRQCTIRSVEELNDGSLRVELEITNHKTRRPDYPPPHNVAPVDQSMVGVRVGIVQTSTSGITFRKFKALFRKGVPGEWLTKSKRSGAGNTPLADADVVEV